MRYFIFIIIIAMVVSLFAFPVYASDGDDTGGILSFLSDILSSIGDFFSGIFDAIWNAITWLLDGIKRLFIPRKGFFQDAFNDLRDKLSEKLGGIVGLVRYLKERFSSLQTKRGFELSLEFPAGHVLNGMQINLLGYGYEILTFIRGALSGFLMLMTFIFCYRRILTIINT